MKNTLSVGQAVKITVGYLKGKQAYIQALHAGPDGDCVMLTDKVVGFNGEKELIIKKEYVVPDA